MLVSEGDSISVHHPTGHTGIYAASRSKVDLRGLAIGGSKLAIGPVNLNARIGSALALKPEAMTVLIGANDLLELAYPTPQAYVDALFAYTDQFRSQGVKVGVGTVLPIYYPNNPTLTSNFNARRAAVNALIRAAVGSRIDAVIDFAADPAMGPDAAARDPNLFSDGLHPTYACGYGCGGQGKMAAVFAPVADKLLGQ